MQIVFDDSRLKFSVRELNVLLRFESAWYVLKLYYKI